MPAALKFGFIPFARPRGVLVVFCEENLKLGPATQQTLRADRGLPAPRRRGRSLHRQERLEPRHRCAVGSQRAAAGCGRYRQGERTETARYRQARRHRHGKSSGRRRDGDDFCGIRLGRAQGRSGCGFGAWRATARLHVRPLQDQAQRGRGAAEQGRSEFRLFQSRLGGESVGAQRGDRRRRRAGARSRQ